MVSSDRGCTGGKANLDELDSLYISREMDEPIPGDRKRSDEIVVLFFRYVLGQHHGILIFKYG